MSGQHVILLSGNGHFQNFQSIVSVNVVARLSKTSTHSPDTFRLQRWFLA